MRPPTRARQALFAAPGDQQLKTHVAHGRPLEPAQLPRVAAVLLHALQTINYDEFGRNCRVKLCVWEWSNTGRLVVHEAGSHCCGRDWIGGLTLSVSIVGLSVVLLLAKSVVLGCGVE